MIGVGSRKYPRGFTLIEALMAAAILAIAVVAAIVPFTCGVRTQDVETRQTLAVGLAQDLMEEILLRPFEEPADGDQTAEPTTAFGPESGEDTRSEYSAIDDYDGYTEQPGQILDENGNALVNDAATGISRTVSVSYVYVTGQDISESPTFMKIIVRVRYNDIDIVTLKRLVHWIQ